MSVKKEDTHILIDRELTLYRRERSLVWQCKFKIDGRWNRASTNERDLKKASVAAHNVLLKAKVKQELNITPVTRRFSDIATAVSKKLVKAQEDGTGKPIYNDYIGIIQNYLIPALGKFNVNNIKQDELDILEAHRDKRMKKIATRSTLLNHNAVLNMIFTEAVQNRFMTELDRPKLVAKGKVSQRRPAFTMDEVQAMLRAFDAWIYAGDRPETVFTRTLLKYYVRVLLDTGARPGKELLNLKWKQVRHFTHYKNISERYIEMAVDGKTGKRGIIGWADTIAVLEKLLVEQGRGTIEATTESNLDEYVFRMRDGKAPTSFQNLFETFLTQHNLLIDPNTNQKRVFYSLRHTYATFKLVYDKTPIHTLAEHMGTSVGMIEKHYSHLKVKEAMPQLRGVETNRLISSNARINPIYASKSAEEVERVRIEKKREGGIKSGIVRRAKALNNTKK